jgi:hypothetical protein
MKEINAYRRDVLEVCDFLLEHRFKKAADDLKESFSEKQATQLISSAYSVQEEYVRHPGANPMTLFKRQRLEKCLSHAALAEAVTEEWGRESARIHKEQSDQSKTEWLKTLKPEQLCEHRMGNLNAPEPKRPLNRRFEAIDIAQLEVGGLLREQTDPSWILPFEHFFNNLWEDLIAPCREGKKEAAATKQDTSAGPERMASLGAYRNDVLQVVDCLLKRKQDDAAKALMSLPDPIQQQIAGAAFSIQAYRTRYGGGPGICLMKAKRLELGLSCDEMAKKIEEHYRRHSSELFKQQRAEFVESWIAKRGSQLHPTEIRALRQGSMEPPGTPRRMIINPIAGGDVDRMERGRPHRELIGETVRPFEAYWGEVWEDLCKLIPIPAPKEEATQAAEKKLDEIAESPAKLKVAKHPGNGKPACSQDAVSSVSTPCVVSAEPTTRPEVAADAT